MKHHFAGALLLGVMLSSFVAMGAEKRVAMKDLSEPVRKAVMAQSKGAMIRGVTKEIENGRTEYEAELTINGRGKDISFDSTGKVISVEDEVELASLPTAARAVIQKAVGSGTLRKVESVKEGGKFFYEASIRKGGKSWEVQVDRDGAAVK